MGKVINFNGGGNFNGKIEVRDDNYVYKIIPGDSKIQFSILDASGNFKNGFFLPANTKNIIKNYYTEDNGFEKYLYSSGSTPSNSRYISDIGGLIAFKRVEIGELTSTIDNGEEEFAFTYSTNDTESPTQFLSITPLGEMDFYISYLTPKRFKITRKDGNGQEVKFRYLMFRQ